MERWETNLLLFLFVIVIILIIAAIVYFGFINKGNLKGSACNDLADCVGHHYCSGDFICEPGSVVPIEGKACSANRQCAAGFRCFNEHCTSAVKTGGEGDICRTNHDCGLGFSCQGELCVSSGNKTTGQASFRTAHFTYTNKDGVKYYLIIDNGGSVWSTTRPKLSYDYEEPTGKLIVNLGAKQFPVIINEKGQLQANTHDDTHDFLSIIRRGNSRALLDRQANIFKIERRSGKDRIGFFNIFNDGKIENHKNIGYDVYFQIIETIIIFSA